MPAASKEFREDLLSSVESGTYLGTRHGASGISAIESGSEQLKVGEVVDQSGPSEFLRVPCSQEARVVMDERVDERNHIGDEVDPSLGWSEREGGSPAQRVVAELPVGQLSKRLGQWRDRMLAVFGDGLQGAAQ